MVTALAFIFVFGLLTLVHEVGHFTVAKLAGIRVEEFGIGFGTPVITTRRGDTLYSLRILPLGGFVKMSGEDAPVPDDEKAFNNKPVLSRLAVIAAGPFMNFILAIFLFAIIFFFVGIPERAPLVGAVLEGTPAAEAGLAAGDRVLSINGERIETWEEMVESIQGSGAKTIEISAARQDKIITVELMPEIDPETGVGYIGVQRDVHRYRFLASLYYGFVQTVGILVFIIARIAEMVTGQIAPEIAGPVGIVQAVGEVARTGVLNLLYLAAILSINIALCNLFPIPMLDGGQLLFLGLEAARGKPLEPEQEGFFRFVGILFLLFLLVIVTYRDISRLIL
jgi:regulator of sigma E protease